MFRATGVARAMLAKLDQAMAAATQASTAATQAEATGQNARQMVLNRDPRLSTLEGLTADYSTQLAASLADRQALRTAVDQLTARLAAVETRTLAVGVATVPALALNGSVDITVTLDQAMPSTAYKAHVARTAVLLPLTTVTVKSQTTTAVVVTVKALAAVALGQGITVIAS